MIVANGNTVEDVFKSSAASLHSDMNVHVGKYNMPSIDSLSDTVFAQYDNIA